MTTSTSGVDSRDVVIGSLQLCGGIRVYFADDFRKLAGCGIKVTVGSGVITDNADGSMDIDIIIVDAIDELVNFGLGGKAWWIIFLQGLHHGFEFGDVCLEFEASFIAPI